ncbi:right-handed parallel beta-helix repeat-containing protein [Candidatus Woesearchaeota archaeon]|nr:MAG: right-handed parallel beta-helix repeat-containing protein [Candidatus Woesearchaeota archaeon]
MAQVKLVLFLLLATSAVACVVPRENMVITESVEFCSDVYYVNWPIRIAADDVAVICSGTVLKSWRGGTGFAVENRQNVTIKDCHLVNHDIGFSVRNSSRVFLIGNHLVKTQVGVRLMNVSGSATLNHDVSLLGAFDVQESAHNVLSLKNKRVSGIFCAHNECNAKESAIETFMRPKQTPPQMSLWLSEVVTGKSVERLRAWVLAGLA